MLITLICHMSYSRIRGILGLYRDDGNKHGTTIVGYKELYRVLGGLYEL